MKAGVLYGHVLRGSGGELPTGIRHGPLARIWAVPVRRRGGGVFLCARVEVLPATGAPQNDYLKPPSRRQRGGSRVLIAVTDMYTPVVQYSAYC